MIFCVLVVICVTQLKLVLPSKTGLIGPVISSKWESRNLDDLH